MNERYTIEDFVCETSVEEYLARFHNPEVVLGYCRECSKYGKQWSCPPFDFDVVERLTQYDKVLLVATKITPTQTELSYHKAEQFIRTERIRLERRLLDLERQYNGLASTCIGSCLHCPEGNCTRPLGNVCRHPECVRPSLEAYGFDVCSTASELLGIDMKWGHKGASPEYLILIGGVFYTPSLQSPLKNTY